MAGKHDNNDYANTKLRYDLIPAESLEEVARVYTIGAIKYGDWDYMKGMKWSRIYASMVRHMQAFWMGSEYDPEDLQHPLASVAWCALTLMAYESRGVGEDDRTWCPLAEPDLNYDVGEDGTGDTPHDAFNWLLEAAQSRGASRDILVRERLGRSATGGQLYGNPYP